MTAAATDTTLGRAMDEEQPTTGAKQVPSEPTPPQPEAVADARVPGLDVTAPTMLDVVGDPADHTTAQDLQEELDDGVLASKIRRRLEAAEASASSVDPLIGREIADRFTIQAKVGEGGMGAVYRARQRNMDRDVAIKVLLGNVSGHQTVVTRFHREALAISRLKHPNTIQIYDFGETDDGRLYIAMEFLEGVSMHATLEHEGVLSVRRALRITSQVAKSLREAHAKGIVHRDLKPDNIFLQSVGEESDFVKVLDFGVAKTLDENEEGTDLTKTGTIFGTPKYMSPEQARGSRIDVRADLYAIGVVLYEMLAGRVPFDAESSLGILIKHIQEPHPSLDQVRPDLVFPDDVHTLVDRLLAKRPEDRLQSAEALIREIARIEEGLDEIYRNVVTREDAIRVGLELATSPRTRHDTRLTGSATGLAPTLGPLSDATAVPTPQGSRWPVFVALADAGLLVLGVGAGAFAYGSLERLPQGFVGYPGLAAVDATVGEVPPVSQEIVSVILAAVPADVEIYLDGEKVDTTAPLLLERPLGSRPQRVTFEREGYQPRSTTVEFHKDRRETLRLTPLARAKPRPPEPTPEAASDTPKPRPKPKPVTAATAADTPKPRPKPVEPKPGPATAADPGSLKVDRLKGVGGGGGGLK